MPPHPTPALTSSALMWRLLILCGTTSVPVACVDALLWSSHCPLFLSPSIRTTPHVDVVADAVQNPSAGRPDSDTGDRSHPYSLRVVSFNILAEIFATQVRFRYRRCCACHFASLCRWRDTCHFVSLRRLRDTCRLVSVCSAAGHVSVLSHVGAAVELPASARAGRGGPSRRRPAVLPGGAGEPTLCCAVARRCAGALLWGSLRVCLCLCLCMCMCMCMCLCMCMCMCMCMYVCVIAATAHPSVVNAAVPVVTRCGCGASAPTCATVQADHFETFLYPAMEARGYDGVYKQKTREPMGVEGASPVAVAMPLHCCLSSSLSLSSSLCQRRVHHHLRVLRRQARWMAARCSSGSRGWRCRRSTS
jgi:hypothetical protein